MSPKEIRDLLQRESKIYVEAGLLPYGYVEPSVDPIENSDQPTDWESDTDSYSVASISQREAKPNQGCGSFGAAWWFQPFPLSKKEERLIAKRGRWRRLPNTCFGEYLVSPTRYDLKWIQRIFWAVREIRRALRIVVSSPFGDFEKELKGIRNQIYSLSPGNGKRSVLQSKLFSDVYYCLRQNNRLKGERGSFIKAIPA